MTTLSDLILNVVNITGRPDLTALITQSILKATIKEHSAIDYPRDLAVQTPIALTPSTIFRYSLSVSGLLLPTNLRKIKSIREVVGTPASPLYTSAGYWGQLEFTEISPTNIFDNYALERYDYFYRQGDLLSLVASRNVDNIGLIYYAMPNIGTGTYQSWIADLYPYVIYEHVASDIFKAIGKDEEAATYRQKLPDNRLDVIKSEIGVI